MVSFVTLTTTNIIHGYAITIQQEAYFPNYGDVLGFERLGTEELGNYRFFAQVFYKNALPM